MSFMENSEKLRYRIKGIWRSDMKIIDQEISMAAVHSFHVEHSKEESLKVWRGDNGFEGGQGQIQTNSFAKYFTG